MLQGTGGFGDVFEAKWRGRRVAVKKLPQLAACARDGPSPEAQYAALIAEIQLSCRFNSSRLVSVQACLGMLVLHWIRKHQTQGTELLQCHTLRTSR